MTNPIQGAKIVFFGADAAQDVQYLDLWRSVPLTYTLGQAADDSFRRDHYEVTLTPITDRDTFMRAADNLLRYRFYPPSLMHHVSDFSLQQRWMQVGDRLVQRIRTPMPFGLTIMEGITMNEIARVIDEPRRKGFTYVTTAAHEEIGEWSAQVEWQADNALVLTVNAISKTSERIPRWMLPYTRRMQKQAHQQGIEYFIYKLFHELYAGQP
ncbi:MAG: DUF1990 family protein [Anaerolineae bacterium]